MRLIDGTFMELVWLAVVFLLGKVLSLVVYRICWTHGEMMSCSRSMAFISLLRQPRLWCFHVVVVFTTSSVTWAEMPHLRWFATILTTVLALGAVGRGGVTENGRFFMADRLLIIVLSLSVMFHPGMVYPALLAGCALQYTVASWRLGPGYSNLLGFEFIRASLSVMVAGLWIKGLLAGIAFAVVIPERVLVMAVMLYQASTYVNHAAAKSALGSQWYSWMRENRLECLVANAWLRGWTMGMDHQKILSRCRWIARYRRWFCGGVWLLESAWLLLLIDTRLALMILACTALFHAVVFWITGLFAYHYLVNHLALLVWIGSGSLHGELNPRYLMVAGVMVPLAAWWVGWLRRKIFFSYEKNQPAEKLLRFADAADHLMAWWDTPLMRMFSYEVQTVSGKRYAMPLTKFSPYDTFLTDLPTHLMILGQHASLDPAVARDRTVARTGVWGLTVHQQDRDLLYRLMEEQDFSQVLSPSESPPAWQIRVNESHEASPIAKFLENVQRHIGRSWFSLLMRWPHFPGEDLVADLCPLSGDPLPCFRFDEPMASVTVWRMKTFCHRSRLHVISREKVGCIFLHSSSSAS